MGTTAVSDSLKIQLQGGSGHAEFSPIDEEEGLESAAPQQRSQPKPEELGNTRGKRMAMKFVNKIANKEKYTQVRIWSTPLPVAQKSAHPSMIIIIWLHSY